MCESQESFQSTKEKKVRNDRIQVVQSIRDNFLKHTTTTKSQTTERAQTRRLGKNEARSKKSENGVEESNMPYEEVLEGKRYRRNRKDLIKTQESPGAKPVKPPL